MNHRARTQPVTVSSTFEHDNSATNEEEQEVDVEVEVQVEEIKMTKLYNNLTFKIKIAG